MLVHRPGSVRRALSALIGILAALLAMTIALPGAAFAAQGQDDTAIPHPEDDWAGSQILKHEGGSTAA